MCTVAEGREPVERTRRLSREGQDSRGVHTIYNDQERIGKPRPCVMWDLRRALYTTAAATTSAAMRAPAGVVVSLLFLV